MNTPSKGTESARMHTTERGSTKQLRSVAQIRLELGLLLPPRLFSRIENVVRVVQVVRVLRLAHSLLRLLLSDLLLD